MKICYLADANSIHTKKLCEYFTSLGYEMTVISLNDGIVPNTKVYSMNIKTSGLNNSFEKLSYLFRIKKVKNIIRDIKPDVVHAHYVSSYGLLAALVGYKPTIMSVWGSDVYDFPKKSALHSNIIKYNLRKADYILSTSNIMKIETEKYTDKNIIVTPFGVDIDKFRPKEKEDYNDTLTIGTIKSLEEKYGIEYLIRAFKNVKDLNKELTLKLVIGGRGNQLEVLQNLCKELEIVNDVEFLGFIPQTEVVKKLQSFDIAVFPSTLDSESFGVAAVEAQACAIPLVVTDVDGLMESTVPDVTSLVAKRKSVDDLTEKMNKLVTNKELREELGRNGRKNVEEKYNIINNFNIIDDIYKSVKNN